MGKKADAPDYSQLAAVSAQGIAVAERMGNRQLDFTEKAYNEAMDIARPVATAQAATLDEGRRQGAAYFDHWNTNFRPLEREMAQDARQFNSADYREGLARQAAADAGRAFTNTTNASARNLRSMGVNPNSGRYATTAGRLALGLAADRADAMTGTRRTAENVGWARQMDATGLGRNLAGASSGAYGFATQAGQASTGNMTAAGNMANQGYAGAGNTVNAGYRNGITGYSNIVNAQAGIYGHDQERAGTMFGAGVGLVGNMIPT